VKKLPEPCLCGAPDCRYCFPNSWKEAMLFDKYWDELDPDSDQSFEEWRNEYNTCEAEYKYDRLQDREDDRIEKNWEGGNY